MPRDPGSFRDPSGFVVESDGIIYRYIAPSYRPHYDRLLASGLYDRLVDAGHLIAHEDKGQSDGAYTIVLPRRVPFISYPYEWSFAQLQAAALTTLEIQRRAIDAGMSLRDASAYNIQFVGTRPVLIDTLSFGILDEAEPWVAYRQFCQHFLGPLAVMAYTDVRLSGLLRSYTDGLPMDLVADLLPAVAFVRRPSLLVHVSWHARALRRHDARPAGTGAAKRFSATALRGLIDSLDACIRRLQPRPSRATWVEYYDEADSYTREGAEQKRQAVSEFLDLIAPRTVWDVGCNTGRFSRLASERKITTVAFDADPTSIDALYRAARRDGDGHLLPLVLDITNPSPALGWAHAERRSLAQRGPADALFALALVHHLILSGNIPAREIAAFLRTLGRWLAVEFVPRDDPQARKLAVLKKQMVDDYSRHDFEASFAQHFTLVRKQTIAGSERVLYLMRARA